MAKYDAFGREIGEDTLSGLGGSSASPVATPPPHPDSAAVPDAPSVPSPPPAPPRVRARNRSGGRAARRIAFAVIIAGFVAQGLVAGGGDDVSAPAVKVPQVRLPRITTKTPPASQPSLLGAGRFESALAALRTADLGRITTLRLAEDRIDVQFLTRGGRLRQVQVGPDLQVRTLSTSGPGFGATDGFGYGVIRPAAPSRLIKAGARELRQPASRINYLVFSRFGSDLQWVAYFRNGHYVLGDVEGRFKRAF